MASSICPHLRKQTRWSAITSPNKLDLPLNSDQHRIPAFAWRNWRIPRKLRPLLTLIQPTVELRPSRMQVHSISAKRMSVLNDNYSHRDNVEIMTPSRLLPKRWLYSLQSKYGLK